MSKFVCENGDRNNADEGISLVDAWIANHTLCNMAPLCHHHWAHNRPVSVVGVGVAPVSQIILCALCTHVCDLQECRKVWVGFKTSN